MLLRFAIATLPLILALPLPGVCSNGPASDEPEVLATFLGGGSDDTVDDLFVGDGNIYAVGQTGSTNFAGVSGGAIQTRQGNVDGFVSRYSADLGTLLQATYLGGPVNGGNQSRSVVVANNSVYVVGTTGSTQFPGTANGAQANYGGGVLDAYVVRLNLDLTTILSASYIGGSSNENGWGVGVDDATGTIYVGGSTFSDDLPTTMGAFQTSSAGSGDVFVAALPPDLSSFVALTYLGGADNDQSYAMVVESGTGVYVAGDTLSLAFPGAASGAQSSQAGDADGFVAGLSLDLETLLGSSYVGGSGRETLRGVTYSDFGDGGSGAVVVTGTTESNDFPVSANAAEPVFLGGDNDAFISVFSNDLSTRLGSSYYGSTDRDSGAGIVAQNNGDLVLVGLSNSLSLPQTSDSFQPDSGGGTDGFLARFDSSLENILISTWYGSTGIEQVFASSGPSEGPLGPQGVVLLGGRTSSTELPGSENGAQPFKNGGLQDGFVARVGAGLKTSDVIFCDGFEDGLLPPC